MYELECSSCGRTLATRYTYCPDCGAPTPALVVPVDDAAGTHRGARGEAALLHVLRDIDDGHLGLWGEPGAITPDRVVPAILRTFDWVEELLVRGWVAPVRGPRSLLAITDLGRAAMRG